MSFLWRASPVKADNQSFSHGHAEGPRHSVSLIIRKGIRRTTISSKTRHLMLREPFSKRLWWQWDRSPLSLSHVISHNGYGPNISPYRRGPALHWMQGVLIPIPVDPSSATLIVQASSVVQVLQTHVRATQEILIPAWA